MAATTISTGTQTTTQDLQRSNSLAKSYPLPSGHSGRLKYAQPRDLPSFPSLGLKKDDAAAGAAASLGWANAKPLALWAPQHDPSAHRAATLASDHKMPAPWQPDRGPPGSMKAAVLAASNASRLDKGTSTTPNPWGNSAANQAFNAAGGGEKADPREPMTNLNRQKSLRAAKGAFATGGRPRSLSSPQSYPDSANAASNALSAATVANRSDVYNIKLEDAGAVPITTMNRQMYTSQPPVKPEVDERNREASLHASAVAMAKTMFAHQQKIIDSAKQGGTGQQGDRGGDARPASAGTDGAQQPMQFMNLQEAAYKLAQERLARLRDQHQQNRGLAEYYGTSPTTPTSPSKKLSRKMRRRASSDGDVAASLGEDDRQRSRQIRNQMSMFSTRLDEVDEAKRSRDRSALLAAAQRNVRATLDDMDEKRYRETGRVAPAKLSEWETKAHVAALARSEARMSADRTGKVDLGAGQYMDRDKVEEIAAKRVQPVLDEINEKAEAERQRILALREEQEKKRQEWEAEKARNAEVKESLRKVKEEEKLKKEEVRMEAKARKEEEKAAKAEEKRLAKEEKSKAKDDSETHTEEPSRQSFEKTDTEELVVSHKHRLHRPFTPKIQTKTPTARNEPGTASPATSPESAGESQASKVKNWLKSRLSKPRARSISTVKAEKQSGGFVGGVALTRLHADGTESLTSLHSDGTQSGSMREVALAGRPVSAAAPVQADEPGEGSGSRRRGRGGRGGSVSSVSSEENASSETAKAKARARTTAALEGIEAPRAIEDPARATPRNSASPERGSKFIEDLK